MTVITVRPYRPEDLPLVDLAAEQRGIAAEDPGNPIMLASFVAEADGRAFAVLSARRSAELGLYLDASAPVSPRDRWAAVRALSEPMRAAMHAAGLVEVHVSVPDAYRSHARRLAALPGATYDVRHHILFDVGDAP